MIGLISSLLLQVSRSYQSKAHASTSELAALQERMQFVERARISGTKELEANLAQTM
jgi:hypothetical protein